MAKEIPERAQRFGERVRALRQRDPDLTQEALASAVRYSRSAIASLENGLLDPILSKAFAFADYFHVPLADLVSGDEMTGYQPLSTDARLLIGLFNFLPVQE